MEYNNSLCFKDSHDPFSVANQTVTFQLSTGLIPASRRLAVRRTILYPGEVFNPLKTLPTRNVYFEQQLDATVDSEGRFTLDLVVNSVVSISPTATGGSRGDHAIPKSAPFPALYNDDLSSCVCFGGEEFIGTSRTDVFIFRTVPAQVPVGTKSKLLYRPAGRF